MKKITFMSMLMILASLTLTTNLNAQLAGETYYSVSIDGGTTTYLSSSAGNRFADYPFGGAEGNHVFSNANKDITIQITDYDQNNPVVGPELYIRFSRVGFGNAPLGWGSDNTTSLMTLVPGDFTAGAATVNVSIPEGTTPVENTTDYVNGYNWIMQIVGANGGAYNDSEHAYMNYVIDVTENILSTSDFNKSKLGAFYSSNIDAVVIKDKAISGSDYKIYDLMGRTIMKGEVSNEISVSNLKTGLYILSTDRGLLKFAK